MKTPSAFLSPHIRRLFLAGILSSAMLLPVSATPMVGECLNVGPAPGSYPNTVGTLSFSGAIGQANHVSTATGSLAVGDGNDIAGDFSLGVGMENNLYGSLSIAFGNSNNLWGSYNGAFGIANIVDGTANLVAGGGISVDAASDSSALFGTSHMVYGITGCLVAGNNHVLDGAVESAAIGHGLSLVGTNSCLVIGRYNLDTEASALFVVGNGNGTPADPQQRRNAFVVKANGNATLSGVLRVQPGGDIPMFGQ